MSARGPRCAAPPRPRSLPQGGSAWTHSRVPCPGPGSDCLGTAPSPVPVRHEELVATGMARRELPAGRGAVVAKAPASPQLQPLHSSSARTKAWPRVVSPQRGVAVPPFVLTQGGHGPSAPCPASPQGGGGVRPGAPQAQGRAAAHRMYPITLRVNCALTPQVPHTYAMQPGGGATAPSPLRAPTEPLPRAPSPEREGFFWGGGGEWPGPAACTSFPEAKAQPCPGPAITKGRGGRN